MDKPAQERENKSGKRRGGVRLPELRIRPLVIEYAWHWLLGGLCSAVLAAMLIRLWPQPVSYFLLLAAFSAILLGVVQLLEPRYSFRITPQLITYFHRYGHWQLAWEDLQRFDIVRVQVGWQQRELPFIGFRLREPDGILHTISPRLASRLLIEQQGLLMFIQNPSADEHPQQPGQLLPGIMGLMKDKPFVTTKGNSFTGLQAMLGRRMAHLHQALGYDLFIPANALDRPAEEFIRLLRDCQASRERYPRER